MKAMLLHLGTNMWCDRRPDWWDDNDTSLVTATDHLKFNESHWREMTARMAERGLDTLVIDLGEALQYPSHPELAVKGSWSPDKMREEICRLKRMGIEAIPKLNFSAGHDIWLRDYSRMLSTPEYYRVCADVIRDVAEIFGRPRLFHMGYDEETAGNQAQFLYCCVRQGELWWHDFLWFLKTIEAAGMRPWAWADACWHKDEFFTRCPKSALLSNWYYGEEFNVGKLPAGRRPLVASYEKLDRFGFEQVPCGSNYLNDVNMRRTVAHCRKVIAPERLKGFLMAPWFFTVGDKWHKCVEAVDLLAAALEQEGV